MTDNNNNSDTNNKSRLQQTREIITELYKINSEVIVPSKGEGSPYIESRDPHLRLRRTLTPLPTACKTGMPSVEEAQFMIQNSTGERISLKFSCLNQDFICDGYFWGASEENATKRIFAVHGITPTSLSRTRWHSLGECLTTTTTNEDASEDDNGNNNGIRFCAIDWHSIDRTDKSQDEFLTMLPKHFFDPVDDELIDEMYKDLVEENRTKIKDMIGKISENCPRTIKDGAIVLRAMIEQGCGWGTSPDKPFILCIKSWSGGIGMEMIINAAANANAKKSCDNDNDEKKGDDNDFYKNIAAAVIMHPAYIIKKHDNLKEVLNFPVIMCWAKDDPHVNYDFFAHRYIDAGAKIVGPETGGHGSFPSFDQDASKFIHGISIIK